MQVHRAGDLRCCCYCCCSLEYSTVKHVEYIELNTLAFISILLTIGNYMRILADYGTLYRMQTTYRLGLLRD